MKPIEYDDIRIDNNRRIVGVDRKKEVERSMMIGGLCRVRRGERGMG